MVRLRRLDKWGDQPNNQPSRMRSESSGEENMDSLAKTKDFDSKGVGVDFWKKKKFQNQTLEACPLRLPYQQPKVQDADVLNLWIHVT